MVKSYLDLYRKKHQKEGMSMAVYKKAISKESDDFKERQDKLLLNRAKQIVLMRKGNNFLLRNKDCEEYIEFVRQSITEIQTKLTNEQITDRLIRIDMYYEKYSKNWTLRLNELMNCTDSARIRYIIRDRYKNDENDLVLIEPKGVKSRSELIYDLYLKICRKYRIFTVEWFDSVNIIEATINKSNFVNVKAIFMKKIKNGEKII